MRLVVVCSPRLVDQVLAVMVKHLGYHWILALPGDTKAKAVKVFDRRIVATLRLVVIFRKRETGRSTLPFMSDTVPGGPDQQFRYLIEHLSKPGQLVVDPFVGLGSVRIACI